jgi:hypothetical protein
VPNRAGVVGHMPNIILDMPPHHVTHWGPEALQSIAEIFNITLTGLHEESIAPQHKILAKKYAIFKRLCPSIVSGKTLIAKGLVFNFLNSFASIFARIFPIRSCELPGHTIIAIYEKNTK